ncbi:MAG TPA: PKD domain-containing protein [Chitinophagaceae bacterium]|nr:PKD domain-containing protein [Chitinophagaceae bacterium]
MSCQKEISCYDCIVDNKPPIAKAGNDKAIILPTDSVKLDGSGSKDPDGTIIDYNWKKISGPDATIKSSKTVTTAVNNLEEGIFVFELMVTDNGGLSAKDTVKIMVDKVPVNYPPIANAGPDQALILPVTSTSLDGSVSWDPDNNITSYQWTKLSGPAATISNANAVQTQLTGLVFGVYYFELKVTDAGGLYSADTVKVTVRVVPNVPPIANAGSDIVLTYNLQSCTLEPASFNLDGTVSTDPDGTIDFYKWELIFTDNATLKIINPGNVIASVNNLLPGNYIFRLQVTDNDGVTDDDTVLVNTVYTNRPEVMARLIPVGNLSQARKVSTVGIVNNKIFFAGGIAAPSGPLPPPGPNYSSRVDIYDIPTNTWSTAELSQARTDLTAVTSGNSIYFAGGFAYGPTSRVDVYNSSTDLWTTIEMPNAGSKFASIAMGNKLFVAGGDYLNIYDETIKRWSSKKLSQSRTLITAMAVKSIPNTILAFMGGVQDKSSGQLSSRIDYYDPVADALSVSELSEPKYGMIATAGVLAGGTTQNGITNKVEGMTGCLFQPNSFSYHSYGKINNDLVFFVWDGKVKTKFDIYNVSTKTWSIGVLDRAITPSLIISEGGIFYVVGALGSGNGFYNQVWKLEF